jgi:hypothetical protein
MFRTTEDLCLSKVVSRTANTRDAFESANTPLESEFLIVSRNQLLILRELMINGKILVYCETLRELCDTRFISEQFLRMREC